jgi:hypothetical protein
VHSGFSPPAAAVLAVAVRGGQRELQTAAAVVVAAAVLLTAGRWRGQKEPLGKATREVRGQVKEMPSALAVVVVPVRQDRAGVA